MEKLDEDWSAPTGLVRLTYRFRDDTHAYWKYSRGWKPGTFNATSSEASGVSVAKPETIDAFETGVRGSWFDGRVGLDLAFFYYSYKDYQLFTAQQFAGGQPEFVILNAPSAEVYGAEVDAVARPWMGAFVNVRFGWLQSQFLDFVQIQQDNEPAPGGGPLTVVSRELQNTGNPLLNSPRFKVSLTGEQTLPLGRWGSVTGRYDGVWTDVNYFDATEGRGIPNTDNIEFLPEDTIAQPAFWLHNLRVSYRTPNGRIELAGWVRNLTNQSYKTFAFDGSTFSQHDHLLRGRSANLRRHPNSQLLRRGPENGSQTAAPAPPDSRGSHSAIASLASYCVAGRVSDAVLDRPRRNPSEVATRQPPRDPDPLGKVPLRKDLPDRERPLDEPQRLRGRPVPPILRAALDVVAPHRPDRRPIERSLPSLRERNRLPLVVRTAVTQQQIRQVHRKERVRRRAGLLRRRRLVVESAIPKSPSSPADRPGARRSGA